MLQVKLHCLNDERREKSCSAATLLLCCSAAAPPKLPSAADGSRHCPLHSQACAPCFFSLPGTTIRGQVVSSSFLQTESAELLVANIVSVTSPGVCQVIVVPPLASSPGSDNAAAGKAMFWCGFSAAPSSLQDKFAFSYNTYTDGFPEQSLLAIPPGQFAGLVLPLSTQALADLLLGRAGLFVGETVPLVPFSPRSGTFLTSCQLHCHGCPWLNRLIAACNHHHVYGCHANPDCHDHGERQMTSSRCFSLTEQWLTLGTSLKFCSTKALDWYCPTHCFAAICDWRGASACCERTVFIQAAVL